MKFTIKYLKRPTTREGRYFASKKFRTRMIAQIRKQNKLKKP